VDQLQPLLQPAADFRIGIAAGQTIVEQVVYLDPMFPHKQKSALVKKEMRVFQSLVGPDLDVISVSAVRLEAWISCSRSCSQPPISASA
jgi:hypothetical protein